MRLTYVHEDETAIESSHKIQIEFNGIWPGKSILVQLLGSGASQSEAIKVALDNLALCDEVIAEMRQKLNSIK